MTIIKRSKSLLKKMLIVPALFFSAFSANAAQQCIDIGGMGLAEAMDETHLVAALSGTMTGAHALVKGQTKTDSGLVLDMAHHFISDTNGVLKTQDTATLTKVPNKPGAYMLEINYSVVDSSGTFAGYRGDFHSYGLMKLDKGQVILRYKGEVCKS
ncbi:MAG: hypothetical protein V7785_13725 [Bermanella sp.]